MRVKRRQKSGKVRRSLGRSNSGSFNNTSTKINTSTSNPSSHQKRKSKINKLARRIRRRAKKRATLKELHSTKRLSNPVAGIDTKQLILKLLGDKSSVAVCCYDDEANQLQDMDLMILGSTPEEYKRYTQLLRQEYMCMNDADYKQMRLKVLQTLLMIPNIFACPEFQARYEQLARTNIKQEIEELKQ